MDSISILNDLSEINLILDFCNCCLFLYMKLFLIYLEQSDLREEISRSEVHLESFLMMVEFVWVDPGLMGLSWGKTGLSPKYGVESPRLGMNCWLYKFIRWSRSWSLNSRDSGLMVRRCWFRWVLSGSDSKLSFENII